MSQKIVFGESSKKVKITVVALTIAILLLAATAVGLLIGGFRYTSVTYAGTLDLSVNKVTYVGFTDREGNIKKGTIYYENKKAKAERTKEGYLLTYSNGDVYEGEMAGFQRSGKGKITYSNGDVYEGYFYGDKMHGKGKYIYESGDVYEGNFSSGEKSGKGVYTWAPDEKGESAEYVGSFRSDRRNGEGTFKSSDGSVYIGKYVNDLREDQSAEVHIPTKNGVDRYYGGYEKDVRSGFGYYFYADGNVYVGEFQNNKPNGEGAIYFSDGGSYKGTFVDGNIKKEEATEIPEEEADRFLETLNPEKNPLK